ncbi:beta-galactosidase trimerization domain-containing protein [Jutongia sp.]|uniref:beta-galactosidase trimerization domain-containing protein n=1 Tax=Jutongia sp. TaxID=2944204 RepID=UPI0030793974
MIRCLLNVNIIPQTEELSEYKLVVAPMMYMLKPETTVRLKEYIQKGGQLLATYVTGYVDQNQLCYLGGFPGDGLKDVFGVISEEIDTFYPTDRNQVTLWDGSKAQVRDYAELLRVQEDVRILGQYDADFYQGMPAVTEHSYGAGTVCYVVARMESQANRRILELLVSRSGLDLPKLPEGVEYHVREAGGER